MKNRIPNQANTSNAADAIRLRGVRVHNLKNIDVDIPRGKLVAICGVSGSGKTSLALDTLYAEGQRRYIESFSAYTRQFLERLEKPDYDSIEGLPPALAVTRAGTVRGNRSTVGTASEILDYLRLLFARVAHPFCYGCGQRLVSHSPQGTAALIESLPRALKVMIGFGIQWEDIGDRALALADLQSSGFVRLVAAGKTLNLGSDDRQALGESLPAKGCAWVIVDRLHGGDAAARMVESLEIAFENGYGSIALLVSGDEVSLAKLNERAGAAELSYAQIDSQPWALLQLSQNIRCLACGTEFPQPQPSLFSFNSPLGACPKCEGFGDTIDLDMDLVVPDKRKTIREGAIAPWTTPSYGHNLDELLDVADELSLPVDIPFHQLDQRHIAVVRDGDASRGYGGLSAFFAWLERKKYKMHVRVFLSRWRSYNRCDQCGGRRLNQQSLAYKIGQRNLAELCQLQIDELASTLSKLQLSASESTIAAIPLRQVLTRLSYLRDVGLGYLTLDRTLRTLSGGESQRTALTAALGSSLVNMLYVLDEPSIGLHPHDVQQLTAAIENLARRGNTVVIVEHEEELLKRADWLLEIGPSAGENGGRIVFQGTLDEMAKSGESLTGDYLYGRRQVPITAQRRRVSQAAIKLCGCAGNNLQSLDVEFPLGVLCLVTGVSGSGKSSLVQDTLYGALENRLTTNHVKTLPFERILGTGQVDHCILVDQSPISRSPRSNPVTFIKAFDEIRNVFAGTVSAKTHNYSASHFSFNSELGRCQTCHGDGVLQVDMQFLADIVMNCEACNGRRYRREILEIKYRDRSISDVLNMTVKEALGFFRGAAKVQQRLKVLKDVGLDYLRLGQSATTLSAGEAQRLKLASYLGAASRRKTLFLLDEPTTGLHMHDIIQLLDCFDALLEAGQSLIVVEHNLHLIAAADYIIDLGPGPARDGGRVVVAGTPEEIAKCPESITGRYLAEFLKRRPVANAN